MERIRLVPLSLGAAGLPALRSQGDPREAGASHLPSPAPTALVAEVMSCLICSSPWQLSSSSALWESAAGTVESHQTPQSPQSCALCPQQLHGNAPPLSARRGYTGVPGRTWYQVLHFPLHPVGQSLCMELGCSGLAAALMDAQGLVQHVQGPWHLGVLSRAGGWGSRQISGSRSSWIKFPDGGVSLGGAPSFSGISQGEDSTSPATLGTSPQLPAVLQLPPGAWSSQVGCAVPAKSPQRFWGMCPSVLPVQALSLGSST